MEWKWKMGNAMPNGYSKQALEHANKAFQSQEAHRKFVKSPLCPGDGLKSFQQLEPGIGIAGCEPSTGAKNCRNPLGVRVR
jgi:hypothetical protein